MKLNSYHFYDVRVPPTPTSPHPQQYYGRDDDNVVVGVGVGVDTDVERRERFKFEIASLNKRLDEIEVKLRGALCMIEMDYREMKGLERDIDDMMHDF